MANATSTRFSRPSTSFDGNTALPNYSKYRDDESATPKVAISAEKMDGDVNTLTNAVNLLDDDISSLVAGGVTANSVTNEKLRDSAGLSVIGRATNTSGDPADIAAASDGGVLRRKGTAVGFGDIDGNSVEDRTITSSKMVAATITATEMASNSVTSEKVADAAITPAKLSSTVAVMPTGVMLPYAGSSAPTGYVLCAGQALDRTDYADLFAIIGTSFGAGNGSSTFDIPDMRGRVAVGLDNMGGTDAGRLTSTNAVGTTGGSETHTLTEAELPDHTHFVASNGTHQGDLDATTYMRQGRSESQQPITNANFEYDLSGADTEPTLGLTSGGSGSGAGHSSMQPFATTNYIIKT